MTFRAAGCAAGDTGAALVVEVEGKSGLPQMFEHGPGRRRQGVVSVSEAWKQVPALASS